MDRQSGCIDCSGNDGAPRNKKLKLLDEMESSVASSNVVDDNVHNEQALQLEFTTYLEPVAVTEEEKLSAMKFWKRNAKSLSTPESDSTYIYNSQRIICSGRKLVLHFWTD